MFDELSIVQQMVLRGTRIVIPKGLQPEVISLAHEGHQGATKMKQYLRARVWFPRMDVLVENYVASCHACLCSTRQSKFQPLIPTELLEGPWQHLASDFKGPVAGNFYFLLIIDEYSRFPEVEVIKSTSAEQVIPHFDRILSTHSIPTKVKTDNGPPFNSKAFESYSKKRGFNHQLITPEQPSSNGLAENFMKMLQKVAHAAFIEQKDPREAVHRYLLTYRATPHSATGLSPAELLFNRAISTTIPVLKSEKITSDI